MPVLKNPILLLREPNPNRGRWRLPSEAKQTAATRGILIFEILPRNQVLSSCNPAKELNTTQSLDQRIEGIETLTYLSVWRTGCTRPVAVFCSVALAFNSAEPQWSHFSQKKSKHRTNKMRWSESRNLIFIFIAWTRISRFAAFHRHQKFPLILKLRRVWAVARPIPRLSL